MFVSRIARRPPHLVASFGVAFVLVGASGCESCEGAAAPTASAAVASGDLEEALVEALPDVWPYRLPDDLPEERAAVGPAARRVIVYLDAGHGAADNPGNTSSFGLREQDFTKALSDDVTGYLEETGAFLVVPSRLGDELVKYSDRAEAARRARADVFVSLHSDVRGKTETWRPGGDVAPECLRSFDAPGFSVLYSDEGDAALIARRRGLARQIGAAMLESRFVAYGGEEYLGLYDHDESEGVFVDRHEPQKRIFVLRRVTMPSVIVETHNALDPREAEAWELPTVRHAFARALGRGILRALER